MHGRCSVDNNSSTLKKQILGATFALTPFCYNAISNDIESIQPKIVVESTIATSNIARDMDQKRSEAQQFQYSNVIPEALMKKIRFALWKEPVVDCTFHPAEKLIEDALATYDLFAAIQLSIWIADPAEGPGFRADLLRLVSHQSDFPRKLREKIVEICIESPELEIRDAATQAAENWGDTYFIAILANHKEPCDWLADYITRVTKDLEG